MIRPVSVNTIIAFAFGNRVDDDGQLVPGPVNEELAAVAAALHRQHDALIWAQWEIAQVLVDHHQLGPESVSSVCPSRGSDGEPIYLSTRGVAGSVVSTSGGAAALGHTVVVAHRDHVDRCLRACLKAGIDAARPVGVELPLLYDDQSGQPWTRNRSRYLDHEQNMAAWDD